MRRIPLLGAALFCLLAAVSAKQTIPSSTSRNSGSPPLSIRTGAIHTRDFTIIEALSAIRSAAPKDSVIFTLEVVPFTTSPQRNLTLNLTDATVGEALKEIEKQDSRYTYEVIDSCLIHVFPRDALTSTSDLLNVSVKDLSISGVGVDELLQYPSYHIPELEAVILRRSHANGYAASVLGSTDAPKVSVAISSGTVRDVLNAASQRTEHLATALGWVYTFRIIKSEPLGGEPRWQVFEFPVP